MTLAEFKRFADENNIVPVSTEIYSKMIEDSVNYAKLKIDIDAIRAEIEKMSTNYCGGYIGLDKQEVLQIIDKYTKGEKE